MMPEFYHVDRVTGRLKSGQVIEFLYAKSEIKDRTNRADIYTSMFPNGVTYHGWEYLLNDKRVQPHQDKLGMIEILAEFIRRSDYPERISRFQSFFACKTLEDAKRFISLYPITTPEGETKCQGDIWLVQCDRVAFEGDMTYLGLGDCWLDAITRLKLYWAGERGQDQAPLLEVLLKPPVTVVKKIKTLL
jgi:hypothetical protein